MLTSALPFRHFSSREGVPQSTVLSITEDTNGHIWLGTNDGLCRISGFHTRTYRSGNNPEKDLPSDEIYALYTDSDGRIWINTPKGVCVHSPGTEEFPKFNSSIRLVKFLDLRNENKAECYGSFLALGQEKLMEIDSDSLSIRHTWDYGMGIMDLGYCEGKVIIGVKDRGLFRWRPEEGPVQILDQKDNCGKFAVCQDGRIWTMSKKECILFDPVENVTMAVAVKGILPESSIRCLEADHEGNLWAATSDGILIVKRDGSASMEQQSNSNNECLGDNSIRSLFRSSDGGMWAGTYYCGAYYYNPDSKMIRAVSPRPISPFDNIICRSIKENPTDGTIWMGTTNLGVLIFNPENKSLKVFRGKGPADETVNAIEFIPDRGKILFGKSQNRLEIITGRSSHNLDVGSWIFGMKRISDRIVLLCTGSGLKALDIDTERVTEILSEKGSGRACSVDYDAETGDIWVGFDRLLVKGMITFNENGLPGFRVIERKYDAETVVDVRIDSSEVWFATAKGLLRYDKSGRTWSSLSASDGWPTNLIRGIEAGCRSDLWISTENGIVQYFPSSRANKYYGKSSGLETLKFNPFAHCKAGDGTIYFGGTGKVYFFNPGDREDIPSIPSPRIIGLSLDGTATTISSLVTIPRGNHHLEILMDVTDFTRRSSLSLEYRLKGYDKEWKNATDNYKATYTSIPKGRYQFEVRTVSDTGVESGTAPSMTVMVKPDWYESYSFIILVILLISSIIVYAFVNQERENRRKIQRIENQAKLDISSIRAEVIAARPMQPKDRDLLMKVIDTIDSNIENEDFGVQELANALEMSRSNLNIRIKAIADTTPLEIIRKLRLEKAYKLLLDGDHQISEVAYATGFASATYFTTYFKKETGLTPRQWIARNKN